MRKVSARKNIENSLHRYGFVAVAGVDEVGRGCLAGPVMAGAVILHPDRRIDGLADSKACTELQRERLYDEICRKSVSWSVISLDPEEIDRINIHKATLEAMRRVGIYVQWEELKGRSPIVRGSQTFEAPWSSR